MLSSSLQFDLRESKESTRGATVFTLPIHREKSWLPDWGRPLTHNFSTSLEQRDSFVHSLTHTFFILKDSLYSRLHSVILKAREAKRGEITAT